MKDWRVLFHCVVQGYRVGENLVVNLNELQGQLGNVGVDRGDGSHGMALVEGLLMGHDVLGHHPEVTLGFGQVHNLVFQYGKVRPGDHREHAGHGLRFAGVNGYYPSVGMGAAQGLAMNHARQLDIGAVFGRPGHFIHPVVPNGPGADNPVWLGVSDFTSSSSSHAAILTRRAPALNGLNRSQWPTNK